MYGSVFYVELKRGRVTFVIVIDDIFIFLYFGRHHPSRNLQTDVIQKTDNVIQLYRHLYKYIKNRSGFETMHMNGRRDNMALHH